MIRKFHLLFIALLLLGSAMAAPVDIERARKFAASYMGMETKSVSELKLIWSPKAEGDPTSSPAFYVFNRPGNGFVMVSGDDLIMPVLAYSDRHPFKVEDMPDNIRNWMKEIQNGVKKVREQGIRRSRTVAEAWTGNSRLSTKGVPAVELETAQWDQNAPYFNETPIVPGKGHTLTGCVATAMSIVARYHRWPEAGQGTTPAYSYMGSPSVPENTLGRKYDYDKMPLSAPYTMEQGKAIAALMYDMGTTVKMNYGIDGSGADCYEIPGALSTYMSYSKRALVYDRDGYSDSEWIALLKNDLDRSRPIMYSGYSGSMDGHEFVLHGYDSEDKFAVNWGWGGYCNGYFSINYLVTPDYAFTYYHTAVLGVEPDKDGSSVYQPLMCTYPYDKYSGLECSTTSFTPGEIFNCTVCIANMAPVTMKGVIYIAAYDRNDTMIEKVSVEIPIELEKGYLTYYSNIPCRITRTINVGDRLHVAYRSDDLDEVYWARKYDSTAVDTIILREGGYTPAEIASFSSLSVDRKNGTVTVSSADEITFRVESTSGNTEQTGKSMTFPYVSGTNYKISLSQGGDPYVFDLKF